MKIADGFDARRLRPKAHSNWRSRLVLTFAALLTLCGVLLLLAGASSLIGHPSALGELNASPAGAIVVLVFGTRRLGSMGGDIGAAIRNFRSALSDEDDGKGGKAPETLPPSTAAVTPASEKTRDDTHAG